MLQKASMHKRTRANLVRIQIHTARSNQATNTRDRVAEAIRTTVGTMDQMIVGAAAVPRIIITNPPKVDREPSMLLV